MILDESGSKSPGMSFITVSPFCFYRSCLITVIPSHLKVPAHYVLFDFAKILPKLFYVMFFLERFKIEFTLMTFKELG